MEQVHPPRFNVCFKENNYIHSIGSTDFFCVGTWGFPKTLGSLELENYKNQKFSKN